MKDGLSYLVEYETKTCSIDHFIYNQGFRNSLITPATELQTIKCQSCDQDIENFSGIKLFILKNSKGIIRFRSEDDIKIERTAAFDLNENKWLIFCNDKTYRRLDFNIY